MFGRKREEDSIELASRENARIGLVKWRAWDDGVGGPEGLVSGEELMASLHDTSRPSHDVGVDMAVDAPLLVLDPWTVVVPVAADLAMVGGELTGRIMKPRAVGPETTWAEALYGYAYLPVERLNEIRATWNKDALKRSAGALVATKLAQSFFK